MRNNNYINVVSWTKGLRYRPNRKQSGENHSIVGYINVSSVFFLRGFVESFVERVCVTLTTGVLGHVFRTTGKDKETLKAVLVEKPERTDAEGVQSVS